VYLGEKHANFGELFIHQTWFNVDNTWYAITLFVYNEQVYEQVCNM